MGRFHPVVLHTPLGLMAGVAAVEALMVVRRGKPGEGHGNAGSDGWMGSLRVLAALTAGSAVAAAVTGYVLSLEGGYNATLVNRHLTLGIAFAIAVCLYAGTAMGTGRGWTMVRRALLVLTLALMIPTGHIGGSMTHGEDFLFGPLTKKTRSVSGDEASGLAGVQGGGGDAAKPMTRFDAEVWPTIEATCIACHGAEKEKGGLRFDTREYMLAGGDSGHLWEAGNSRVSLIVKRMRLPLDDDDHMPPEGKPQPTEEQIKAIEAWIDAGASFDEVKAGGANTPGVGNGTRGANGGTETPNQNTAANTGTKAAPTIEAPPVDAVAALKATLGHAEPVSQENPRLLVSFAAVAPTIDDAIVERSLSPLAGFVEDLSLARTKTGDRSVALAAKMSHLKRLDVSGTKVTPEGLCAFKGHGALEELVISRTAMGGDAGFGTLSSLLFTIPELRRVYLWESGLNAEQVARLRKDHDAIAFDAGDRGITETLETEPEVKLTSDAPPLGSPAVAAKPATPPTATAATPVAASAEALKPINSVCPVSGSPVKPEYQILYKGKVIGFCCPNCPKTFWEKPDEWLAKIEKAQSEK